MDKSSFSVHLPASLVSDSSDLRQKTLKVGGIGRALAIFRVENVFIFKDNDSHVSDQGGEIDLVKTLLEYMETPQYLRKGIFPYMEELRFAGLLPPLRTPHHPLQDENDEVGDCREALVIDNEEGRSRLNLGLPQEGVIYDKLEQGTRVTVKLKERVESNILVERVDKVDAGDYWGFEVHKSGDLAQSLSRADADYLVGTSRRGQNLYEGAEGIKSKEGNTSVAFGGPYQGLFEVCEGQGFDPDDLFDIMVNTIPRQGTQTVRTEEAMIATLAIVNVLQRRK